LGGQRALVELHRHAPGVEQFLQFLVDHVGGGEGAPVAAHGLVLHREGQEVIVGSVAAVLMDGVFQRLAVLAQAGEGFNAVGAARAGGGEQAKALKMFDPFLAVGYANPTPRAAGWRVSAGGASGFRSLRRSRVFIAASAPPRSVLFCFLRFCSCLVNN
jgi:hypothetical protein